MDISTSYVETTVPWHLTILSDVLFQLGRSCKEALSLFFKPTVWLMIKIEQSRKCRNRWLEQRSPLQRQRILTSDPAILRAIRTMRSATQSFDQALFGKD